MMTLDYMSEKELEREKKFLQIKIEEIEKELLLRKMIMRKNR